MTASKASRQRKLQELVGSLAVAKVDFNSRTGHMIYRIRCTECFKDDQGNHPWTTYRQGRDNGHEAAVDRWVLHLARHHPRVDALCLSRFEDAKLRADQRRAYEQAVFDEAFRALGVDREDGMS